MLKKIRYKFTAVTISLMGIVFSILFFTDYLYSKYWDEFETLEMLKCFAEYNVFLNQSAPYSSMQTDESFTIYFVIVDKNGTIITSTGNSQKKITKEVVDAVLSQSDRKWKLHSYIYTTKKYENSTTGIYLADTSYPPMSLKKAMQTAVLFCIGFCLLLVVSYYLSKFIVKPAENAFLREKQFISDASHELKTPIAAISVNAHALSEQLEGNNKHLKYILSEAERMDRLIHQLLTLSFLEGQKKDTLKETFLLSHCCEEIALTMESITYEKRINFVYDIDKSVMLYGNEDEIRQLIFILMDNAVKHTEKGGEIQFKLSKNRNRPTIVVFNTGTGIAPENLPHIFERFYSTVKNRTEKTDSFGLGLSIAKAITENHGGVITVESEINKYARFSVIF